MSARQKSAASASRPAILVQVEAPPEGDVVFTSTDRWGTPGQLNALVLEQLGQEPGRMPTSQELAAGYAIETVPKGRLCYLVTLDGERPAGELLSDNLARALADTRLAGGGSWWIPLVGTGEGGLSHGESFEIVFRLLATAPPILDGRATAVVSLPPDIDRIERGKMILRAAEASRQIELGETSDAAPEAAKPLPRSPALTAALALATRLARLPGDKRASLSTSLLFFALAESRSGAAPAVLRADGSARAFADAVRALARERYGPVWKDYFKSDSRLPDGDEPVARILKPTPNVASVLTAAEKLAAGAGERETGVDPVVRVLLEFDHGGLRGALKRMGVVPEQLLAGYCKAAQASEATEEDTEFVPDDAEDDKDSLDRAALAIALARRLHRIWCERNRPHRVAGASSFVVHLDAPWGGGKTTFANYLGRVLNPRPAGGPAAGFLAERFLERDLGGVFLGDFPTQEIARTEPWERRPWVIVNFNAWQYEHCTPPWWVFYQAIRHQCFAAVRREGNAPWHPGRRDGPRAKIGRYGRYLALVASEYGWRLTNPKIAILLLTAVISAALLLALQLSDVVGVVGKPDQEAAGFVVKSGIGLVLAGLSGISAIWGTGALLTESILPGTDTLAERISLGKSDPFQRFREHFDHTLGAVARPVLVVVDDLDRCQPSFVVDLVRGIQTILRSSRLVFLILGDRDWIERAFESHHNSMSGVDVGPEQTFGARFVEKAIQMSFMLPSLGRERQKAYVQGVLLTGYDRGPPAPVRLKAEAASRIRELTNEAADGSAAPHEREGIIDRTTALIRDEVPGALARNELEARREVERIIRETQAINATVSKGVEQVVVHELTKLAGAFPANPRQIKRIVNAITMYWAVSMQRLGPRADAELRYQLAIWVILMTEWPQTWRTLIASPKLVDCVCGTATLASLKPHELPGKLPASERELERIAADLQLKDLLCGSEAEQRAPLSSEMIPLLAELTPMRTRKWRLSEAPPVAEGAVK